jgi:predicted nucleotidyltransferase
VFGSAAIGGWAETISDVDLILVVPDGATELATDHIRAEVERIEIDSPAPQRLSL